MSIRWKKMCWKSYFLTLEFNLLNTPNIPALVILDRFRGQSTEKMFDLLQKNNIHILI
jgi:hypothetical protein